MQNIFTFLLLLFSLNSQISAQSDVDFGNLNTVQNYQVDQNKVANNLKILSSNEFEGRKSGTVGGDKAAQFLADFLKEIKAQPYFATYHDTLQNFSPTACNIVGLIEGNDPNLKNEFVIFGAHYDHIGITKSSIANDSINNGANDDASGVVAVMEIARYFAKHKNNKRSILIAFFAAEEDGLIGSEHLAKKLKKSNLDLYTMLNFEMIGVPMKANHTSYVTGFSRSNISEKINHYAEKNLVGYLPMEFQYQLFMRSDNFPFFLEFNVPCHAISTFDFKNFSYYHHVKDEFEMMDTVHMTALIQDYIKVTQGIANSLQKEIILNPKK